MCPVNIQGGSFFRADNSNYGQIEDHPVGRLRGDAAPSSGELSNSLISKKVQII